MGVDEITVKPAVIAAKISEHYVDNARDLPWRVPPGGLLPCETPNGIYAVWLSEIMLQQTTVQAVRAYFHKFMDMWPTVHDLAAANEEEVLAAWAGLGYYARARNLYKCAYHVSHELNGVFPNTELGLRALPGVGDYTAAAIAAIGFGERAIVVDANIERIVARLYAIDAPLPGAKRQIKETMEKLTPAKSAGDFAQACMDIGATICTAKAPKCPLCPVREFCAAHQQGAMEIYPVKPAKKAKPIRTGRMFWIEDQGKIALVQRPDTGMLAGMRGLPDDRWNAKENGDAVAPMDAVQDPSWRVHENIVQHSFTHFSLMIDLAVHQGGISIMNSQLANGETIMWWPLEKIDAAGLPTVFMKAVRWKMKED